MPNIFTFLNQESLLHSFIFNTISVLVVSLSLSTNLAASVSVKSDQLIKTLDKIQSLIDYISESDISPSNAPKFSSSYLNNDEYNAYKKLFDDTPELARQVTNEDAIKVLIVGAGPVGLLCALMAYESGAEVTLVEKRNAYTRHQVILLDKVSIKDLKKYIGSENYDKMLDLGYFKEDNDFVTIFHSSINHIEMALALAVENQAKRNPKFLKVLYNHEFDGSFKDGQLNNLVLKTPNGTYSVIKPDWVLGADSIRSRVSELAGFKQYNLTSAVHAGIAVFKKHPDQNIVGNSEGRYSLNIGTEKSFYLATELSSDEFLKYQTLLSTSKKRDFLLDLLLDSDERNLPELLSEKDFSAFPIQIKKSDKFATEKNVDGKKIKFFIAGDAAGSTHFFAGNGTKRGFEDARIFSKVLLSPKKSVADYNLAVKTHLESTQKNTFKTLVEYTFELNSGTFEVFDKPRLIKKVVKKESLIK